MSPIVITIDGPAGAGKSTVAKRVATELGIPYLDTGAMYRAVTLHALRRGWNVGDPELAERAAREAKIELRLEGEARVRLYLDGEPVGDEIRTPAVSDATSRLASHPGARAVLVELQRNFLSRWGGVLEGRDTGTHVAPEARFKFYLDATLPVRVARRREQLERSHQKVDLAGLQREVEERDERDSRRPVAPLLPAADAVRIDTSCLTVEEVVARILEAVRDASGQPEIAG